MNGGSVRAASDWPAEAMYAWLLRSTIRCTRRIHAEQHRAPEEPSAAQRLAQQQEQRTMPAPLPEPSPLRVDTEETEIAAKRLAALLRDNPSLLRSQD